MVNKKSVQESFLEAIDKSFKAYNDYGPRSSEKLIPIHSWFAEYLESNLGKEYSIKSLGHGKEENLQGKYYPKDLDITVIKKNKVISTISFKFVTSNYKQNSNNYFENLLGETANIRRMNVGFAHFLVLRSETPYYDKNKGNLRGNIKKIEKLNDKDLEKYIKLFKDQDFPHKPDLLGISILDLSENAKFTFTDLKKIGISDENINILKNNLDLDIFLNKFIALCKLKE